MRALPLALLCCGMAACGSDPALDSDPPDARSALPDAEVGAPDGAPADAASGDATSSDAATDDGGGPPETSPCLAASQVISLADLPDGERLAIDHPADHVTYDLRGVDVRAIPSSHLIDLAYPQIVCITGVSAIAEYPPEFVVNWEAVKASYDKGGIHTSHPDTGTTTFDRVYVEGIEDGLMIARLAGDTTQEWAVSDSYFKNVVDDTIEDDGYRSGEVIDVLAEGVHNFFSARNTPELPYSLLIEDSVIGFACKADPRTDKYHGEGACPDGSSMQRMFKLGDMTPEITVRNTVIHYPAVPRSGKVATCLPDFVTYQDVTLVWTGTIDYPCATLPVGVTLSTDQSDYDDARADWLSRHGCASDGSECGFLQP